MNEPIIIKSEIVRAVRKFAREWPRTFRAHLKELRDQDADDLADALKMLVEKKK